MADNWLDCFVDCVNRLGWEWAPVCAWLCQKEFPDDFAQLGLPQPPRPSHVPQPSSPAPGLPPSTTHACSGSGTFRVTGVTGYGDDRQEAHDTMLTLIAMLLDNSKCQGDCGGGDECVPVPDPIKAYVDCKPYRTKVGEIKWRCRYSGDCNFHCECNAP